MYARKRPLPLCVYSVVTMIKRDIFLFSEVITELESEPMGGEEQDQVEDGEEDEEEDEEDEEDGEEDEDEPEEDEQDKEDDRASLPFLEARKEQQGDRTGKL
jgi:TATA-binding protein-associated factor Taf7